ncbi:MAG: hypothetical protein QXP82_00620 [Candidatus Aenigmatarchaeota archaeon]|nr:hypothetical protein [Candidatus Aenigmarchaeota archaeon]
MKKRLGLALLLAAISSIVLYSVGIFTGFLIQKSAQDIVNQKIEDLSKRIENIQLEYVYLTTIGDKLDCTSLSKVLEISRVNVWNVGKELVALENEGKNDRYNELKREYSIISAKAWILNSYFKDKCKRNEAIILYIYSPNCVECEKQGKILDSVRDQYFKEKMLVFVLDYSIKEPIVETIKTTYDIKYTPTIIIGTRKYEGLVDSNYLVELISKELT